MIKITITFPFHNYYIFNFLANLCYNYHNLSDANRKSSYVTPISGLALCDEKLPKGWYRFVGAAGTRMPTKRVPAFRCDTDWSGWLDGAHPTVEDGEVQRTVCFSNRPSRIPICKHSTRILVKNCESYLIYKLFHPHGCASRYCGTDWIWSKYTWRSKRTHKKLRSYICIRFLTCDLLNLSSLS